VESELAVWQIRLLLGGLLFFLSVWVIYILCFTCCFAEMSDNQQQIQGINRQYDQLGESLSDHQRELQFMMLGVTSFSEDFERILLWLHCTEEQLIEHGEDWDETRQVRKLCCCSRVWILSLHNCVDHNILLSGVDVQQDASRSVAAHCGHLWSGRSTCLLGNYLDSR